MLGWILGWTLDWIPGWYPPHTHATLIATCWSHCEDVASRSGGVIPRIAASSLLMLSDCGRSLSSSPSSSSFHKSVHLLSLLLNPLSPSSIQTAVAKEHLASDKYAHLLNFPIRPLLIMGGYRLGAFWREQVVIKCFNALPNLPSIINIINHGVIIMV